MQMDVTGSSMYTLTLQIYFIFLITNVQELILLLQSRGLIIADPVKAERHLEFIGYYRLSAYMYPLLQIPNKKRSQICEHQNILLSLSHNN